MSVVAVKAPPTVIVPVVSVNVTVVADNAFATVVEPESVMLKIPTPDIESMTTTAPAFEPASIDRLYVAPVTAPSVMSDVVTVPASNDVFPDNDIVPKVIAVSVDVTDPLIVVVDAVLVTPPVNVSPPASVTPPVLLKVTAFVMVPPPLSAIEYP